MEAGGIQNVEYSLFLFYSGTFPCLFMALASLATLILLPLPHRPHKQNVFSSQSLCRFRLPKQSLSVCPLMIHKHTMTLLPAIPTTGKVSSP